MTDYMEDAFKKALKHRVQAVGAVEHRFEVTCRDKGRLRGRRERHTQECILRNDECVCSCQKPKLLHKPCTHVIASCFEAGGLQPHMYVSHYYVKETIWATWRHEIYGYKMVGDFIQNLGDNASYIPDPDPDMVQGVGRRKKKRIQNNMDQSEAGPEVRLCSKCHETGHTYKNCQATVYATSTTNATSTSSVPTSTRGQGRRAQGNTYNVV